jgi:hypothetical protein
MKSPDDVPTRIVGESPKRDSVQTRRDDFLAIAALLSGVAIAFLGRKVILELAGGVGLGLGGALVAIRGGKPIQGRTWLVLALVLVAALGTVALELYQEWSAGQWFAEGAPTGATPVELYRLHRTLAGMRVACLVGGLVFLLGAVANKVSGDEKEKEQK